MVDCDEELCRRVAQGEGAAFELLVERYQERAYRLAWSIVKDGDEARDLSQEAFIRLYRTAASFDARARFSTWFYRILVNLCLDHRRKFRRWYRMLSWSEPGAQLDRFEPDQLASPLPGPEEETSRRQTAEHLAKAMETLSDRQRAALMLSVGEGMTSREAAAIMGCSEATVRVHLHRALTELKKTMGKR